MLVIQHWLPSLLLGATQCVPKIDVDSQNPLINIPNAKNGAPSNPDGRDLLSNPSTEREFFWVFIALTGQHLSQESYDSRWHQKKNTYVSRQKGFPPSPPNPWGLYKEACAR